MSKNVVIFYTWSGQTRKMAEIIANHNDVDMLEVKPITPYSQNYDVVVKQAKDEIYKSFLPEIENTKVDLSRYDVIYIGTPVWWGTMAPPLATFLKAHNFNGKTIMPFCTHGGGGKGHSDRDIERLCTGAIVKDMYVAYEGGGSSADKEITAWIKKNIK